MLINNIVINMANDMVKNGWQDGWYNILYGYIRLIMFNQYNNAVANIMCMNVVTELVESNYWGYWFMNGQ